jgi:hypothetical protein
MKLTFVKVAVVAAFAAARVIPAAAMADAGSHGHSPTTHGKANGKNKVHNVTYVFKGTWNATAGTLTVKSGNHHVRKAGLVGQDVQFDLTSARIVVADTNGDGQRTLADLQDGDSLVIKARLPRTDPGTQPFKAKMAIDQTHPKTTSGSSDD